MLWPWFTLSLLYAFVCFLLCLFSLFIGNYLFVLQNNIFAESISSLSPYTHMYMSWYIMDGISLTIYHFYICLFHN